MARPQKNTVTYFPLWKPTRISLLKITDGINKKDCFKVFRQSSSAFIKKTTVRDVILNKYNNKCVECSSDNSLQIDHIVSVYKCFRDDDIYKCNTESNLQVLCASCNAKKQP
jgi:5-methylcytosine-specific restriction endonuclease McrA